MSSATSTLPTRHGAGGQPACARCRVRVVGDGRAGRLLQSRSAPAPAPSTRTPATSGSAARCRPAPGPAPPAARRPACCGRAASPAPAERSRRRRSSGRRRCRRCPSGAARSTLPHGVVERDAQVAAIGVRDVHADLDARDRHALRRSSMVSLMPALVLSGIARSGVDARLSVCGARRRRRQQAAEGDRRARRPMIWSMPGWTACRSTTCCSASCRRRSARAGPANRSPASPIWSRWRSSWNSPSACSSEQLVVAGGGHLLVAVVAVLVDMPDRQPLAGQRKRRARSCGGSR